MEIAMGKNTKVFLHLGSLHRYFFFVGVIRVNTLGFLSYRFFELGGVDINQGTIRRLNHVMR